jgi:hypothetical protein
MPPPPSLSLSLSLSLPPLRAGSVPYCALPFSHFGVLPVASERDLARLEEAGSFNQAEVMT